jgi:hypothetical protein
MKRRIISVLLNKSKCHKLNQNLKTKIKKRIKLLSNFIFSLFHSCTVHYLILSSLFIHPTNSQLDCSKRMLKFTLIFTIKVLLHVSV